MIETLTPFLIHFVGCVITHHFRCWLIEAGHINDDMVWCHSVVVVLGPIWIALFLIGLVWNILLFILGFLFSHPLGKLQSAIEAIETGPERAIQRRKMRIKKEQLPKEIQCRPIPHINEEPTNLPVVDYQYIGRK